MASDREQMAAELGGTAFLVAIVVGSGIMAQRLSLGNESLALLANSIATGAGLYALVATLIRVSSHFNPAVTALAMWRGEIAIRLGVTFIAAQFIGAVVGVIAAHSMFGEELLQTSTRDRSGLHLAFADFVATLGLLLVITLIPRRNIAAGVAAYITAAYWFTASTSFANPAVTVARALTSTMTGIAWSAVPWFIAAQLAAVVVVRSGILVCVRIRRSGTHAQV